MLICWKKTAVLIFRAIGNVFMTFRDFVYDMFPLFSIDSSTAATDVTATQPAGTTVRFRCNTVNFLKNTHNKRHIARP